MNRRRRYAGRRWMRRWKARRASAAREAKLRERVAAGPIRSNFRIYDLQMPLAVVQVRA